MLVNISVRELVYFVMRSGSLDRQYASIMRMRQGTALHRLAEAAGGEGYCAEVPLECDIGYGEVKFHLSGRADGIIPGGDTAIVEEIKSTSRNLCSVSPEDYPEYIAQAECYAYMYAASNGLDALTVRITFISTKTHETQAYDAVKTADELRESVLSLLGGYYRFALIEANSRERFFLTAHKLKFPHHDYRPGQQDIILESFHAIRAKKRLFVQAPTGIGKTLSVCYGAVKAIGEGGGRRIFYLTPKSTVSEAPEAAFMLMRDHGLSCRVIKLTAKDKCCFSGNSNNCQSSLCDCCDGHFDRINDALYELLSGDDWLITKERIADCAKLHKVCPYELSLDASLFCDVIICDCNYLFDPRVYLRRFFGQGCDTDGSIALIDEAHDLVDRAREMYSAELKLNVFLGISALIPRNDFILYLPLKHLCDELSALRKLCRQNEYYIGDERCGSYLSARPFAEVSESASEFYSAAIKWLEVNGDNASKVPYGNGTLESAVRDAAYDAKRYGGMVKLSDEHFLHFAERQGKNVKVRLICIDPSPLLDQRMGRVRSAVLFSATLKPIDYFCDLLGGKDADVLTLPSPFDRDQQFNAIMHKVSTRYADREYTLSSVIDIIDTVVNAKFGNYLVFLPSYEMLRSVVSAYRRYDPSADIAVQKPDMNAEGRSEFLSRFKEDSSVIGFAVLGGMFSESIDLAGERLIGTIIVGTGLARLNSQTNIIADYFSKTKEAGFEYAYLYPAINKVLQAAGRVIRSENDRGVCILVDDRYATPQYSRHLCDHLKDIRLISSTEALCGALEEFWNEE